MRGGTCLEFPGDDSVDGQDDGSLGIFGGLQDVTRRIDEVTFGERLAHAVAIGQQEGVGHGAADHQRIDLLHEVAEQVELGRDLGPAHHGRDGRLGRAEGRVQRLQLGFAGKIEARPMIAGLALQERLESLAFEMGGGDYSAPAQLVCDFVAGRASTFAGPRSPVPVPLLPFALCLYIIINF